MSDIIKFDSQLFMLANYEASEGLIPILETNDEVIEYRKKVSKIFNKYKKSIQSGECDFDFIFDHVMSMYGAIPRPNVTPEEIVDKLIEGEVMSLVEENPTESFFKLIAKIRANKELPPSDMDMDDFTID